ncbi:MAG: hypothetical protein COB45_08820, partial [Gammaproteobacteria bacterium]
MTTKFDATKDEEKQKAIRAYFGEIKIMRAAYDNPELEWASLLDKSNAKRKNELKIAEKYLAEYPMLNDENCSGRGLPAFTVKHMKEYLLFPVEELKKDEPNEIYQGKITNEQMINLSLNAITKINKLKLKEIKIIVRNNIYFEKFTFELTI